MGFRKIFFCRFFKKHFSPKELGFLSTDDFQSKATLFHDPSPASFNEAGFLEALASFTENSSEGDSRNRPRIVCIEGPWLLHFPSLRNSLDHCLLIHCDEDTAWARKFEDDAHHKTEVGTAQKNQWKSQAAAFYQSYLAPHVNLCQQRIANDELDKTGLSDTAAEIALFLRQYYF